MSDAVLTGAPRIFGIPAAEAPVVAVMRRGPTDWWHLGRWDVAGDRYEPGAWFKGALYPQKCDLSPDGRWFGYSALKYGREWSAGDIYEAVSRLPWLEALAAWNAGTTYTRGFHFVAGAAGHNAMGVPDVGDIEPCLRELGIALNPIEQFAVERRRGWSESADTPARTDSDPWDDRRNVELVKVQPGESSRYVLHVSGSYAGHRSSPQVREPAVYSLTDASGAMYVLDDVQWADWDERGRLLMATTAGELQIRVPGDDGWHTVFAEDLTVVRPDPRPAPPWATEW